MVKWLKASEFAATAGISRQAAVEAMRRALDGKPWRGRQLQVRTVAGRRGGRGGVSYEVALSSLCETSQSVIRTPAEPSASNYIPRIATPDESKRALELFRLIGPAIREGLTPKQRGMAVRQIQAETQLPRKSIYNYLARYQAHGIEGLMRKRPSDAGQERCYVSIAFDQAFVAAGYPADELIELGTFVDDQLKGLWKSRAADSGENEIGRIAAFLLWERCAALNRPMPLDSCAVRRRRVRQFKAYKAVHIRDNDAAQFRSSLPTVVRDWTRYEPMEIVCADVKHLDVMVTRPDGGKAYPKLIGFMDCGTQRVFPYLVLCPERRSITQKLVIEAFISMCHAETWGFPRQLYLDNGSEFGGLDRIVPALALLNRDEGREIVRAQPYNANSKPIEALFARLDRYVFCKLPGYTGPDRTNKKTQNVGRDPIAWPGTWQEFHRTVGSLIELYHQRPLGGQWGGRSSNQILSEKIAAGWRPVHPKPLALELAFCERKFVTLRSRAIRHDNKSFWHPELSRSLKGTQLELLLPWKADANPIVMTPNGAAFELQEDYAFGGFDLSGAREAGRRRQDYRRAVAKLDKDAPDVDLLAVSSRMARCEEAPQITGRARFLDQGAEIHDISAARLVSRASSEPNREAIERERELTKRRTDRLFNALAANAAKKINDGWNT